MPAPFELPVLVPGTALALSASAGGKYMLKLLTGLPLQLARLAVGNATASGLPQLLSPGDAVQWGSDCAGSPVSKIGPNGRADGSRSSTA